VTKAQVFSHRDTIGLDLKAGHALRNHVNFDCSAGHDISPLNGANSHRVLATGPNISGINIGQSGSCEGGREEGTETRRQTAS
jgi:hypothetical protein